jgi:hypothetical protein
MDATINAAEARDLFVVFDGPPSHDSGRFVELEDAKGRGVGGVAEWKQREDGYWTLGPFRAGADSDAAIVLAALYAPFSTSDGSDDPVRASALGSFRSWLVMTDLDLRVEASTGIGGGVLQAADDLLTAADRFDAACGEGRR